MAKDLEVTRWSGAGNTFWAVVSDTPIDSAKIQEWTKELCRKESPIPTDGFFALHPSRSSDSECEWQFLNSDGSVPQMCGNAARCAVALWTKAGGPQRTVKLKTLRGVVEGQVLSQEGSLYQVEVILPLEKDLGAEVVVEGISGLKINTGVPHFVIPAAPDKAMARRLRSHASFGNEGSNITFFDKDLSVSFERGVEDFTAACGTGAIAAAAYVRNIKGVKEEVEVRMPGGSLWVRWSSEGRAILRGPAELQKTISKPWS